MCEGNGELAMTEVRKDYVPLQGALGANLVVLKTASCPVAATLRSVPSSACIDFRRK